jgi:NitT/TauT family transport system substrate-binding protein
MNSSNVLISRWDTNPLKMKGKKVAIFNSDPNYLTFIMNHHEKMHYEWVPFTSGINLFLSGAVDATMAVSYNEYYQLLQSGFKMSKESIYRFSDHDYNIQETGVYVKRDYFLQHRSACEKFAKASRQGWEWAAKHQKEALDIVMKYVRKYNSPTNLLMQKFMLEECLRLQINKDTGKREFRVRQDMVKKASRMMTECRLIARPVSYKEIMGQ